MGAGRPDFSYRDINPRARGGSGDAQCADRRAPHEERVCPRVTSHVSEWVPPTRRAGILRPMEPLTLPCSPRRWARARLTEPRIQPYRGAILVLCALIGVAAARTTVLLRRRFVGSPSGERVP